jgi:AcrR family transcriptional regulator
MDTFDSIADSADRSQPKPREERRDPVRRARTGGRSARVQQAIHAATMAVLLERGYEALTIAEIAQRAHVHETSIYRRWGTRRALVLDVLLATADQQIPLPDTGNLRDDLITLLHTVAAAIQSPLGAAAVHLSVSAAETPDLEVARAEYWRRRFKRAAALFERAAQRGDIAPTIDPSFALELLIAPLFLRRLVTGAPLNDELPARIVDTMLLACGHGDPRSRADRPGG